MLQDPANGERGFSSLLRQAVHRVVDDVVVWMRLLYFGSGIHRMLFPFREMFSSTRILDAPGVDIVN
jgi:hypothetical protein